MSPTEIQQKLNDIPTKELVDAAIDLHGNYVPSKSPARKISENILGQNSQISLKMIEQPVFDELSIRMGQSMENLKTFIKGEWSKKYAI